LIALAYHLASRLAYVLYIGLALTRQERSASFTRRHGADEGFRRFRRVAATLMHNDAASFVWLCVATRFTLRLDVLREATLVVGAVLVVVGLAVKLWAAASLAPGAYYWRDFFVPAGRPGPAGSRITHHHSHSQDNPRSFPAIAQRSHVPAPPSHCE